MPRHKQLHHFSEDIWRQRREHGDTFNDLTTRYDCSPPTIYHHIRKIDVKVREYHEAGMSLEQLAKKFQTTKEVIDKVLKDSNDQEKH